jgi:ribosomal protein S18 acetylase RimI-like enzyme
VNIVLETLTIDPSAQGLGIGSKMLDKGLEVAKDLGLTEAWLEASDAGYGLYLKYGWRDVEVFTIDFAKYGAEGSTKVTIMKREGA